MNVVILGAGGLLGSNLVTEADSRGFRVVGTYHTEEPSFGIPLTQLDIRNRERTKKILTEYSADVVVNCAAVTDVDRCQDDPELANEVNAMAPGQIASICTELGSQLIHISTDYVFDGQKGTAYKETDATDPIQVYGSSKLKGEQAVRDAHDGCTIARLSFVWGIHRSKSEPSGFPAWVRDRMKQEIPTPLFTDQWVTPTRAGDAADVVLDLAEENRLFHVAAKSCVTPYEFGLQLCEQIGADQSLIKSGSQDDVDRLASRPNNTCLDVSKVESTLGGQQPDLSEDLDVVFSS